MHSFCNLQRTLVDVHGSERHADLSLSNLQEALHDESADQVAVNFFGDGTANNGKLPATLTLPCPQCCLRQLAALQCCCRQCM